MAETVLDPRLLRLWRQAERLGEAVAGVRVLRPRDAPPWPARSGRWDEAAPHQHAVPTLVACLAGVVRIETARRPLDLQAGEVCVVAPAAWHAHAPLRRGSAAYGQGLVFARSDVLLADEGGEVVMQVPAEPVRGLLDRLVEQPDAALVRRLIVTVTASTARAYAPNPAISRMAQRMWAGLHLGIDAGEVLAASGLSARQSHRLFSGWFGTTPKQALLAQRLALAAAWLREGATVATAAAASGFPGRPALTRAWRRAHGAPPTG